MGFQPVDYDPFAPENLGDPEAAGAAAASQAMQPAIQAHLQGVGSDLAGWAQSQADQQQRLQGAPLAQRALDPQGLDTATSIALSAGPGSMSLYRAGGPTARYGSGTSPTFYSTTPEGAAPYSTHGDAVTAYDVPVNNLFDTSQGGTHRQLYQQFLDQTGHPGRYGQNGNPFWTAEPDLAPWLRQNNIDFDAIKFDENTGHPSIAVYPQPGITAYHGSPADFNAFDSTKIGTGEGAQAYGHGLYFADNEGIAKGYRDRLSPPAAPLGLIYKDWPGAQPMDLLDSRISRDLLPDDLKSGASELYARTSWYKPEYVTPDLMKKIYGELNNTITNYTNAHSEGRLLHGGESSLSREQWALEDATNARKVLDLAGFGEQPIDEYGTHIQVQYPQATSGKMYKVGIDADPDHFLHWDKPLSEQSPQVQAALSQHGINPPQSYYSIDPVQGGHVVNFLDEAGQPKTSRIFQTPEQAQSSADSTMQMMGRDPTGGQVYESPKLVPGSYRDPEAAAQALRDAGIPGIKYHDANSRGSNGEPSHNYVVFDDKMIDILRKYGLAPLIAGGALTVGGNADAATHLVPVDHDPFAAQAP